jgi:hypothetical protein
MKKISLFCATANPLEWEYPAREFIEYHEPYVDEIIVCDAMSTDGWREHISGMSKVKVIDFKSEQLFSRFGQAGMQKAVARAECQHEYMIHMDIDTFLIGIEKVQALIAQNPDVDDFPVRILNFYGSWFKVNLRMEGSDPYQHTIMKNIPQIGIGRSFPTSDGAEFVYIENPETYRQCRGKSVYEGHYIRQCPLKVKNIPDNFSYDSHEFALYHYGWCCRSWETINRKMHRQYDTQEKEWGERPELIFKKPDDPELVDFTGQHPKEVKHLVTAKWVFK